MEESFLFDFNCALVTLKISRPYNAELLYVSSELAAVLDPADYKDPEHVLENLFPTAPKPVIDYLTETLKKGESLELPSCSGFAKVEGYFLDLQDGSTVFNFVIHKLKDAACKGQESQKNLFETRQLFQRIAENFPRGTIDVLDTSFNYIYTEGTEYQLLGIEPSSLIGTCHLDMCEGLNRVVTKKNLTAVLQGDMVTYEMTFRKNHYLKNAVPLRNERDEIDHILLVQQNITNSKKLEAEREILIKDLKSHNEELLRFAYIVSHNLRAPIVNISLLLDLYNEENPADKENEEVIENLKVSTTLLNATLQDLIEVVSIKKQKIPKVELINFHLLLNNIEKSLFNQLKESGIKIHKDFSELLEMNYVYAHLENFFMNFLTNSVKYRHPDRPPEVWIKTRMTENYCVIHFRDNGIGLDLSRYGDRLFGLYQRFHNHVEGKGMGLYLVREQIRANDGKIEIESEVGKGLEFTIYLRNLIL